MNVGMAHEHVLWFSPCVSAARDRAPVENRDQTAARALPSIFANAALDERCGHASCRLPQVLCCWITTSPLACLSSSSSSSSTSSSSSLMLLLNSHATNVHRPDECEWVTDTTTRHTQQKEKPGHEYSKIPCWFNRISTSRAYSLDMHPNSHTIAHAHCVQAIRNDFVMYVRTVAENAFNRWCWWWWRWCCVTYESRVRVVFCVNAKH